MKKQPVKIHCQLCGCLLGCEKGTYAQPTISGRSYGTWHHYIAKRFFSQKDSIIFNKNYYKYTGKTEIFCYECHEELLHNPIFLPKDIDKFAMLIRRKRCGEGNQGKILKREKIGQRIMLLHKVISKGLDELLK